MVVARPRSRETSSSRWRASPISWPPRASSSGRERDTPASLSFALAPGEKALLLGANGAGKTTLLLRIVGLLHGPGVVRVGDEEMSGGRVRRPRRGMGFLWQNPDDALLLPTVVDDVALGPVNDGCGRDEAEARARGWLERLGVAALAERAVRELSLGEKHMVSVAGVLAREPGLLLLDEPCSALDMAHRERLAEVLADLPATVLMTSHDPAWWGTRGWARRVELGSPVLGPA
jgi:cobalt/nickel transport system ATP-binding protein